MNTKFRVWDKRANKFLAPDSVALSADCENVFVFDTLKTLKVGQDCEVDFYVEVYAVYENDLLQHSVNDGCFELVYFDDEWLSWAIKNSCGYDPLMLSDYIDTVNGEFEIVGNIHENREMFFGKEQANINNS